MLRAGLLFLLILSSTIVFEVAAAVFTRAVKHIHAAKPAPLGTAKSVEGLDPLFQAIIKLRDEVKRLDSPSSFVQFAQEGRKLIKLEAQWKQKFNAMTPEEQRPYVEVLAGRGEQPSPQTIDPAEFLGATFKSQIHTTSSTFTGNVITGPFKTIFLWLAIHAIVGYNAYLRDVPFVVLPATFFSSTAKGLKFPLSLFMSTVSPEAAKDYLFPEQSLTEMAMGTDSDCRLYYTLGFFGSMVLCNWAVSHVRHEMRKTVPEGVRALFGRSIS